jgi:hypothetical protein
VIALIAILDAALDPMMIVDIHHQSLSIILHIAIELIDC